MFPNPGLKRAQPLPQARPGRRAHQVWHLLHHQVPEPGAPLRGSAGLTLAWRRRAAALRSHRVARAQSAVPKTGPMPLLLSHGGEVARSHSHTGLQEHHVMRSHDPVGTCVQAQPPVSLLQPLRTRTRRSAGRRARARLHRRHGAADAWRRGDGPGARAPCTCPGPAVRLLPGGHAHRAGGRSRSWSTWWLCGPALPPTMMAVSGVQKWLHALAREAGKPMRGCLVGLRT